MKIYRLLEIHSVFFGFLQMTLSLTSKYYNLFTTIEIMAAEIRL